MNTLERLIACSKSDDAILAVILFGSAAREEATSVSDTDVCLVLKHGPHFPLELSRKKLDYVARFDLDVHVYQQLPLYIRRRVLKEGKILFCQDEDALYEVAFKTIREFGDFEHGYRQYLEAVANDR